MTCKEATRNAVKCKLCNTIAESKSRHHFSQCECGAIFTDGGLDPMRRRGGDPSAMIDMSEYKEHKKHLFAPWSKGSKVGDKRHCKRCWKDEHKTSYNVTG